MLSRYTTSYVNIHSSDHLPQGWQDNLSMRCYHSNHLLAKFRSTMHRFSAPLSTVTRQQSLLWPSAFPPVMLVHIAYEVSVVHYVHTGLHGYRM